MTWDKLVKSQTKDYRNFLGDYKESLDLLNADKALLLGQYTERNAPQNIKDKIERDKSAWESIWGINGRKIKAIRMIHQKELNSFYANPE